MSPNPRDMTYPLPSCGKGTRMGGKLGVRLFHPFFLGTTLNKAAQFVSLFQRRPLYQN